mmetsp:Transcript_36448/g.92880  ORF Transcript_36448/g.92880 Transcript_36448/m.92880 type:complete len:91 (+) Transcript_36448:151-423(+)
MASLAQSLAHAAEVVDEILAAAAAADDIVGKHSEVERLKVIQDLIGALTECWSQARNKPDVSEQGVSSSTTVGKEEVSGGRASGRSFRSI